LETAAPVEVAAVILDGYIIEIGPPDVTVIGPLSVQDPVG
jgi:hypothetical protein